MKASASITKGAGSLNHNRRKFLTDNVDKDRVKDDIILIDRDIKMVYEEVFGEALEKYNAKQKEMIGLLNRIMIRFLVLNRKSLFMN